MNTIQLQDNVSFETYQKIVDYIQGLGVKIKHENLDVQTPLELTKEDLKNIEISHQQAENEELLDSSDVYKKLKGRYED